MGVELIDTHEAFRGAKIMNKVKIEGRGITRFTLVVTLVISIIANVTHAVRADSDIPLALRVPGAAIWPLLSFLAIEIIVRVQWQSTFSHYLARTFVLGPAIPAVIVSYEHQSSLLTMMGENALVSTIGPLAIDGLMIGCTLALLFTRASIESESAIGMDSTPDEIDRVIADAEVPVEPAQEPAPAVVEPAPRARALAAPDALSKAVKALQDGQNTAQAKEISGLSAPTVRRYAAVVRTLRRDANAPIDARKLSVRADVVDGIRAWARLESVR